MAPAWWCVIDFLVCADRGAWLWELSLSLFSCSYLLLFLLSATNRTRNALLPHLSPLVACQSHFSFNTNTLAFALIPFFVDAPLQQSFLSYCLSVLSTSFLEIIHAAVAMAALDIICVLGIVLLLLFGAMFDRGAVSFQLLVIENGWDASQKAQACYHGAIGYGALLVASVASRIYRARAAAGQAQSS